MGKVALENSTIKNSGNTLGAVLIELELLTTDQLSSALEMRRQIGGKLGDILLQQSMITPEDLAMAMSIQLNIPLVDLKRHTIQPDAVAMVAEETARKHMLIPLDIIDGSLHVIMSDPEDISAIQDIQAQTKMRIEAALGIPSHIKEAIDLHYRASDEIEKRVSEYVNPSVQQNTTTLESVNIAETPITQTLDLLMAQAVRDRASDVHIEPQENRLRIRYRIDGILHDAANLPLSTHAPLVTRLKILAGMNIAEQRRPQDGQFSTNIESREIDVRAATTETTYGERVTLRILDKALSLLTLTELGFLPDSLEKYQKMLKSTFGMILVAAPTGAGKTTTLYSSINQFNRNERNIMTIEDPVEYRFHDINQIQVNEKAGITFATGLRAIMRHDPDIILVGEVRDGETARMAIQSALTGHLVLSSVHANDSIGSLFRLMDLGIEPYLISSTVVGVVAQRMIRRVCIHCWTPPSQPLTDEQIEYEVGMGENDNASHNNRGCNFCANTGYLGRTGVFEVLIMSEEIRRMLSMKMSASDIREQALREGLITMKQDGLRKAKKGITTAYEVMRNVFSID